MFGVDLNEYDKRVYEEELRDFLPEKFIDVHVHLWEPGTRRDKTPGNVTWTSMVAPSHTYEDMEASFSQLFPGKKVGKIVMGSPNCDLSLVNPYVLKCAKEHGLPAMYCTRYDSSEEEIGSALESGFLGIKPYLSNAPKYIPPKEVRIFDFLTPRQLSYLEKIGGYAVLHIPRAMRLRDPVNLHQMMEIDEKYPNAKVIICHVGRAYIPEDVGDAFEVLRHSKNLVFDFSANTSDYAMEKCLEAVGTKRVMFASDMPFTKMRMRRIGENGTYVNIVPRGLYGDVSGDPHMRESDEKDITLFMYEELRAFRRASERLGLNRSDIEDIMYKNAAAYYGIEI